MMAYEFYRRDETRKEHFTGILLVRRKNPERITKESALNWGNRDLSRDGKGCCTIQ
jgi:hypothetical protein